MKNTPSNCKMHHCFYNQLPPPENAQECISCPFLKLKRWMPKAAYRGAK